MIDASIEVRAERIIEEYAANGLTQEFIKNCQKALNGIKKRLIKSIGKDKFAELGEALLKGNLKFVTRVLLESYYDPLYKFSQDQYDNFALVTDADDLEKAVKEIDFYLKQHFTLDKVIEGKIDNFLPVHS